MHIDLQEVKDLYKILFDKMWIQRYTSLKVQQFFDPYAGRNLSAIRNPLEDMGIRKDQYRVNCAPWLAMNDLVAGFSGGLTPRDRPFIEFVIPDEGLMEDQLVQLWLKACRDVVLALMEKSGFYEQIEILYRELATFGTATMVVWEDMERGAICKTYTFGEYVLGLGEYGEIDKAFIRTTMTVARMEEEFGFDNLPDGIQQAFLDGRTEDEWYVINGILPANYWSKSSYGEESMEYDSVWFIEGATSDSQNAPELSQDNKLLRKKRFRMCPMVTPRWYAPGAQIYGTSPVTQVLGDIMQIQKMEADKLIGEEKMANPPLMIPDSLRSRQFSSRAGVKNYYAPPASPEQVAPVAGGVKYEIEPTAAEITNVMTRIDRALFRDVFMAMSQLDPSTTAYQASKVWQEKIDRIGPIVKVIQDKVLRHLVDRYWDIALNLGLLPPPPPNLPPGGEIKIEYTSFLSLALKQNAEISTIQQALAITAGLMQVNPNAGMIWNWEETQRGVNRGLGLNPKFLHSKEDLQAMLQQQAEQQAQMQQMAQMQGVREGAAAAKDASQTNINGQNILEHMAQGQQATA